MAISKWKGSTCLNTATAVKGYPLWVVGIADGVWGYLVFVMLPMVFAFHKGAIGQGRSYRPQNTPPGKQMKML